MCQRHIAQEKAEDVGHENLRRFCSHRVILSALPASSFRVEVGEMDHSVPAPDLKPQIASEEKKILVSVNRYRSVFPEAVLDCHRPGFLRLFLF